MIYYATSYYERLPVLSSPPVMMTMHEVIQKSNVLQRTAQRSYSRFQLQQSLVTDLLTSKNLHVARALSLAFTGLRLTVLTELRQTGRPLGLLHLNTNIKFVNLAALLRPRSFFLSISCPAGIVVFCSYMCWKFPINFLICSVSFHCG